MPNYSEIMQAMAVAVAKASHKIRSDFTQALMTSTISDKQRKSGLPDFVTSTDIESQKIIQNELAPLFPEIEFVGEEGEVRSASQAAYFLVDPIDGTSNFVALRDYFACCAAYIENGTVKAAVIADPMRGFLVKAYEGGGCMKSSLDTPTNDEAMPAISSDENLSLSQVQLECELAMNKPYHFAILSSLVPQMSGMRKSGSTALDMANLALGRKIALISEGLEPHDVAAGLLIVREAGGIVTDFNGTNATVGSRNILAGSKPVHQQVLPMLKL